MKILNKPAPFNQKQLTYLKKTFDSWLNVLEGGKRGGKNVLNTYAFCIALETHPDKFHLIAGTDTSSARVNIGDCNGYGLQNYFANRFKIGENSQLSELGIFIPEMNFKILADIVC